MCVIITICERFGPLWEKRVINVRYYYLLLLLREVEAVSASVGLRMNEQKTKYLVENIHEPEGITSMGGQKVELMNDFLYLGAKIRNSEEDIATRKKKAWTACHSLIKSCVEVRSTEGPQNPSLHCHS